MTFLCVSRFKLDIRDKKRFNEFWYEIFNEFLMKFDMIWIGSTAVWVLILLKHQKK